MQGSIQWLTPTYGMVTASLAIIGLLIMIRGKQISSLTIQLPNKMHFKHPLLALIPVVQTTPQSHTGQLALLSWVGLMLSLAMAQPIRLGEKLPELPPERDIILLVDVSISMTLKDYSDNNVSNTQSISRLAVLKRLLNDFIAASKGARLAIIVFAEQPYLFVPLTRDISLLQAQLKRLDTTLAGRVSALGDAITLGLNEAAKQAQRKQIFVLFTDVNDSVGQITPNAAARLAAEAKIPLYNIAIGSVAKEREDIKGGLLYQAVNINMLQALSKQTQGKTYIASQTTAIAAALQDIQQLQKNKAKQQARYLHEPLYFWLLLLAILPLMGWQLQQLLLRMD
jgi:Ca-activated chloride channel family protein